MRRVFASLAVLAALAGCARNEEGRKAIADQCAAGGGAPEVCECLATASSDRLDQELFDLVVLGAGGHEDQVAQRVEELTPELQAKFSVVVPEIIKTCGADAYLAGS